jgi:hypothetical protein
LPAVVVVEGNSLDSVLLIFPLVVWARRAIGAKARREARCHGFLDGV